MENLIIYIKVLKSLSKKIYFLGIINVTANIVKLYIKELDKLREVLPMDDRDKLNLSKIFGGEDSELFQQFSMATETALFKKLRIVYAEKYIRPNYGDATDIYAEFWDMMYYKTFTFCFNRYMRDVLALAGG